MISCYLQGGLGNYMFQIAATESLAKDNNDSTVFSMSNTMKVHRHIVTYSENILRKINFDDHNPTNVYEEPKFSYNKIPYTPNVYLIGYFQSEKYFINNEKHIRDIFSPTEEDYKYINEKYGDVLYKKTCSIHVRRCDYLDIQEHHPSCDMGYYNKGINHMDSDTTFVVFSDDIKWCKENFIGDNFYFVEKQPDYIDLQVMSMCDNNITANSSFSWWGAWLNKNKNKIVVSPSRWFGPAKSNFDSSDIIPENWIKI